MPSTTLQDAELLVLFLPSHSAKLKDMPGEVTVITGYYRYTDIWFDWHQSLPELDDRAPLKAILAHDAIVHDDHPLHIKGVKGVQLFMGRFLSGEARLLFSSAQVDYLRYWLHAMKLTKTIIPLPYSDCLLTESNFRTISPVVYADGGSLRQAIKIIAKNNQRFKDSNPLLTHRRHVLEQVKTFWAEKKGVWCAFHFEAWELDHVVLTEFGWSLLGWKDGTKVEECGHLIVEEAQKYTNSLDYRYNYNFGTSEIVKKVVFETRIRDLIAGLAGYGPVFLAVHDNKQDIRDLKTLGVELAGLSRVLPEAMPDSQIFVVDTSDLIGALLRDGPGARRKLKKACNWLFIRTKFLHNAGNDAHYTLLALRSMAEGDYIDIQ